MVPEIRMGDWNDDASDDIRDYSGGGNYRYADSNSTAPKSLKDVFSLSAAAQDAEIRKHLPSIRRLHEIVQEIRQELDTTEIGFEMTNPASLRKLGVQHAEAGAMYGLISVKDAKFMLKMNNDPAQLGAILYARNIQGTHEVNATTCFYSNDARGLSFNLPEAVDMLKQVMAKAFGQLTALDSLAQYTITAQKPGDGKKPPTGYRIVE